MNLLLLEPHEVAPDGTAQLTGRRATHAREVLKPQAGTELRVGVIGGNVGSGQVLSSDADALSLRVELASPPPSRPRVDLVLAIPRPKALKKVLPAAAALGVDRVVLVNAARVEKSYFDSKVLAPEFIRELLLLGLEQARDTRLPEVLVRERLKPFVEDELDGLFGPGQRLLADPTGASPPPARTQGQRLVLGIGPEGGWVPFELALFAERGFTAFSLGPRILRVEVAVPYALGSLGAWTA